MNVTLELVTLIASTAAPPRRHLVWNVRDLTASRKPDAVINITALRDGPHASDSAPTRNM
jgi:hypothetical protein